MLVQKSSLGRDFKENVVKSVQQNVHKQNF